MVQRKLVPGERARLQQLTVTVFRQQVRRFALVAEADFIYRRLALAACLLRDINIAKRPMLQMFGLAGALRIDA
ncbi:hypothetical protein D3C71_1747310 [compost metagenome]